MRGAFTDEQATLANREIAEERQSLLDRQADLVSQIDQARKEGEAASQLPQKVRKLLDPLATTAVKRAIITEVLRPPRRIVVNTDSPEPVIE